MTYLESYLKCDTVEELVAEVKRDVITAMLINPDRVHSIEGALNEAVKEKGWQEEIEKLGMVTTNI